MEDALCVVGNKSGVQIFGGKIKRLFVLMFATYLAPSPIAGVGCFAAVPIKAGEVVWRQDERLNLCLTPEQIDALPTAARGHFQSHGFMSHDGRVVLSIDDSAYVNHSDEPNIRGGFTDNESIAVRDIAAGEEITENYMTYGPGYCRAFLDRKIRRPSCSL